MGCDLPPGVGGWGMDWCVICCVWGMMGVGDDVWVMMCVGDDVHGCCSVYVMMGCDNDAY